VHPVIADLYAAFDVVGPTIAEFIPQQVSYLQQFPAGFLLLGELP